MTQVKNLAGDDLKGMMGGMAGSTCWTSTREAPAAPCPACESDAHVAVWNALEAGDEASRPPLPRAAAAPQHRGDVLVRGLQGSAVPSRHHRLPEVAGAGLATLDEVASRELDLILQDLAPLLTATVPATAGA